MSFNYKPKTQVVIAAALLIASGALVLAGLKKGGITAQAADQNYSTTWTATKILTVAAGDVGSKAGVGVWKWSVNGTVGSTTFTETWDAPSITGVKFQYSGGEGFGGINQYGCDVVGVDTATLLAGCMLFNTSLKNNYTFSIQDVDSYSGSKHGPNYANVGSQQATSCTTGGIYCTAQTGAYSFITTLGENTGNQGAGPTQKATIIGTGTLMPLRWNVTGTIRTP